MVATRGRALFFAVVCVSLFSCLYYWRVESSLSKGPTTNKNSVFASKNQQLMADQHVLRFFDIYGKVQRVMFRKTLMLGAVKGGLEAAATNVKHDKNRVTMVLRGSNEKIDKLIQDFGSGRPLNSWGAKVSTIQERPFLPAFLIDPSRVQDEEVPLSQRAEFLAQGYQRLFSLFQVSTFNFEEREWSDDVQFFL